MVVVLYSVTDILYSSPPPLPMSRVSLRSDLMHVKRGFIQQYYVDIFYLFMI